MNCSTPGSLSITNSRSSLKLMSIESVMASSHLILCCQLLLLPPIPPSIRVFSKESVLCIRWPKYWRFSLSISSSNEYSGLISFRTDWLDPSFRPLETPKSKCFVIKRRQKRLAELTSIPHFPLQRGRCTPMVWGEATKIRRHSGQPWPIYSGARVINSPAQQEALSQVLPYSHSF